MIAKRLESMLTEAIWKTDLGHRSSAEMVQRFQNLRGFGLLPRGRGKNAETLSPSQVVAGLLSVVSAKPGFAGLASKVLMGLRPVGGTEESFGGAETFGKAIELLVQDPVGLNSLLEVRVSESEIYKNSHGRAMITYEVGNVERTTDYVGGAAVSLLGPGKREHYDRRELISAVITETVFFSAFFREVQAEFYRREIPAIVDDDDEDEEAAQRRRAARLGILRNSRFLNVGVSTQATWPAEETLIEFEEFKLVLMPRTRENAASVHVDLPTNGLSVEAASTLINRFLSLLAWCDDQFAYTQGGWSGNPVPVPVPNENFGFSPTNYWFFSRTMPGGPETRKALAIYREGRNAEQNHLISYAVLAYYKIIELKYAGRSAARIWLQNNYSKLENLSYLEGVRTRFEAARGSESAGNYLYRACRTAVAHANKPFSSDPDDFEELKRLNISALILRELARTFIRDELGVPDRA